MVGVAVKVTLVPVQIVLALAEMFTLVVRLGLTVIVTLLDVTVVVLTQAAVDVITQVTTSEFDNVFVLNVALLVPALNPFTFH